MINPHLAKQGSPSSLVLRENEVHIWLVQSRDEGISTEELETCLSSVERDRAAKFKFAADRRRHITAHAGLRSILSLYVNGPAQGFQFEVGAYGKPKLAPIHGGRTVEFNLSHSHEVALVAITEGREIGIDVEWVRENFAFEEVAQRFFTVREMAALKALPHHLQREAFYKCWTSKEAFLKAKGTGLSGELDEIAIVVIDNVVRVKGTIPNFSLSEPTVGEGYVAALVVNGIEPQLTYHTWQWRSKSFGNRHV